MADLSLLDDLLPARTHSPDETVDLGRKTATALAPADVVVLIGELGTGKTHLVSGVVEGLGGRAEDVTSPTFTIAHEYDTDPPVYHLDLYRLSGPEEVRASGVADYLESNGICFVEWPERAGHLLPADSVILRLTHGGGDNRRIERITVPAAGAARRGAGGAEGPAHGAESPAGDAPAASGPAGGSRAGGSAVDPADGVSSGGSVP